MGVTDGDFGYSDEGVGQTVVIALGVLAVDEGDDASVGAGDYGS